ncbi:hypothetical protein GWI33_001663 [Rhynchophorus ferrugineus]|uniref:Uncharacterized protein n=1 Tax=Rhynchophorus ferrugineus TaxID=354439 RepID=A0A834IUH2_RHYFE|nr:hypothetical protein GWI33_001663 [Rhynchophorus ferrugineus]
MVEWMENVKKIQQKLNISGTIIVLKAGHALALEANREKLDVSRIFKKHSPNKRRPLQAFVPVITCMLYLQLIVVIFEHDILDNEVKKRISNE